VEEGSAPLCNVPQLLTGCQPIDEGQYIFDVEKRAEFLAREPKAKKYLHPFIGSEEFINGGERWILILDRESPGELRSMPAVMQRIAAVRKFRSQSRRHSTLQLANCPTRFQVTVIPDSPFLVIPEVSSEKREYVPIGWLKPPTIPSNLVRVLLDADLWHFGILTSAMHMAWLRQIGGRLESRYRYSIGIVYNPFPWPEASDQQRANIRSLSQAVLNARAQFPSASLADLYDVDAMPPQLRKAHHAFDSAVDKLYRSAPFGGDRDRVEHLFGLYEKIVAPLIAAVAQPAVRRARRPVS
jgi:hypothetical protein